MAEIAVTTALALVMEVLPLLRNPGLKDLNKEIESFRVSLRSMQAFLGDMEAREVTTQLAKHHMQEIQDVAYDIEDILDEFMLYVQTQSHPNILVRFASKILHWRQQDRIASKMDDIMDKLSGTKDRYGSVLYQHSSSDSTSRHEVVMHHNLDLDDDEIIGFQNSLQELGDHLVDSDLRRISVSVVGPGGSGKTTLVKNTFKSKRIQRLFDCHAWVQVTRSFDAEKLLNNMLHQFCSERVELITQGQDIQEKLKKYLHGKRFIVVLDDIWRRDHWVYIQNVLPNEFLGSRIIMTTRNSDVVSSGLQSPGRCILKLTPLPGPEAWLLFCKTTFGNSKGKCPATLKDCAERILKKCEGLPLSIITIGGLLSQKPPIQIEWKKLHKSLGYAIQNDNSLAAINKVLLESYKDLTSNLKKCFLYFSNFPEGYAISPGRLIRLWVAERFIDAGPGKMEDAGKDYLNTLIQRNLIHVVRSNSDGQVKSCRVQNLVLEFIVHKAKTENFVSVLVEEIQNGSGQKFRRLSIHEKSPSLSISNSIPLDSIRSVFLPQWDVCRSPQMEPKIISELRLLRVLDVQGAALTEEIPECVFLLTLLRYLSLRSTRIETVPKSIKKLTFLETLDLRYTKVTKLPAKIVRLVNLRNLFVYSYNVKLHVAFNSVSAVELEASEALRALANLQKLSVVKVDKYGKIVKALGELTQLRKLGLLMLTKQDGKQLCESIKKMKDLTTLDVSSYSREEFLDLEDILPQHLQRLHLKGRLERVPKWIPSLHNLFKITLMWSKLSAKQSSPLKSLQDLPNLMELRMVDAYCGPQLIFEAGRFKKLRILYIGQLDELRCVLIEEQAMPKLQQLSLSKCEKMETLFWGINNLACVERFLLYQMPKDFVSHLKSGEGSEMVSHIPIINSFTVTEGNYWTLENLSVRQHLPAPGTYLIP